MRLTLHHNAQDEEINGRTDLLDLFPVWLDISKPLAKIEDLLGANGKIQVKLKHADDALNFVTTSLSTNNAGAFLTNAQPDYSNAKTRRITSDGVVLPNDFITALRADPSKGVILIEGRKETWAPLAVEIWREGRKISRMEMPLRVAPVEEMMTRVDLRRDPFTVTHGSALPPSNGKNVVFLHGFNVTPTQARAWWSEMYKRQWQSGSNARFHGVTWRGDIGLVNGLHYHDDVVSAFQTAPYLAAYVNNLPGQKIIMAHSLGNMVVSSAIADHGLNHTKYFMLNAAVPAEAYDPSAWNTALSGNNMVHEHWINYLPRTWSTFYHKLFDYNIVFGDDDRNALTWRGRFSTCLPGLYNYYSSGDEVFEQYGGTPLPTEGLSWHFGAPIVTGTERYSWQKQELYKGRDGMDDFAGLFGTDFAGWGFELVSQMGEEPHPIFTAAEANGFSESDLSDPLCTSFRRQPAAMFTSLIPAADRCALLAQAIPALSGAVGNREITKIPNENNINMNDTSSRPNGWGRVHDDYQDRWLHSDLKGMSYFYNHKVFESLVEKGGLK